MSPEVSPGPYYLRIVVQEAVHVNTGGSSKGIQVR
jgi:hypothetical protein